jgi:cytosine/adenosine deaminase-related metal-dependent hydrolase
MSAPEPRKLPTEVELVLEVMPCQAMRRSYDSSAQQHPCAHFAEWGFYHSFDYAAAGPPSAPGVEQPSVYRGKRPLLPEVLSGCRKAPIVCVGINPNLPGWWSTNRSAVNPYFEDFLQYAHYFRYRSTAKLRIPPARYNAARKGAPDDPTIARPLVQDGDEIALERDAVTMYVAYQSLLDGLANAEGWTGHSLQVGEDLSYANMVACPSARRTERPNPDDPTMPVMGVERARGIVQVCFYERKYFLRQLFQSLPAVLLVFSATTARHFIMAMRKHFRPLGAPGDNEGIDQLLGREIRLIYGRLPDGIERISQRRLLEAFLRPAPPRAAAQVFEPLDAAAPFAPKLVLLGKVVTMTGSVVEDGAVYLSSGNIDAVLRRGDAAPLGFQTARTVETGGVIYPGLLDLHNHLAYNVLPLWNAGRSFANRSEWMKLPEYRRVISGPMGILAKKRKDLIKPIVRYIEAKLLIGGVTSGQGMKSTFGGVQLYHGLLRNFEQPDDPLLPAANHLVPDLKDEPEQIAKFRRQLDKPFFFHLAEGRDQKAHAQFELLQRNGLLGRNLIAIHSVGLKSADFAELMAAGAKVVWSPLSNLLLYGRSLDIAGLLASGTSFSLGSDWTPSGSRNILFELKVARLAAQAADVALAPSALAEAVTVRAAQAVGWGHKLGTVQAGRYADLLVLDDSVAQDPYENLVRATERNVRLVLVAGHPRYGDSALIDAAGIPPARVERIEVGGRAKLLQLEHPASPLNGLSLGEAISVLTEEMSDLQRAESRSLFAPLGADEEAADLELDLQSEPAADEFDVLAALPPLKSLKLDPLTVIDDPSLFTALSGFAHLPDFLTASDGVAAFYR